MWCLLEWRWDQGGTPYPFKEVSSPAGQGRALSLKESPVGTKISSLISPASGSALERAKKVVRDPGETVPRTAPGATIYCDLGDSAQLREPLSTFSKGGTQPGWRAPPVPVTQCGAV